MLGAIIGDIVGSYYEVLEINAIKERIDKKRPYDERVKILDKRVSLFSEECSYTDDSVLTLAIAYAILNNVSYEDSLRKFGLAEISLGCDKYGRSRFGSGFVKWLENEKDGNSFGNGAAMRISPVGYYFDDMESIYKEAECATIPSHNHVDAIAGARAVAMAIFLARTGCGKDDIKEYIQNTFGYSLDMCMEDLQHNYKFTSKSIGSVPQAIFCFLESNSFEDAIRKAISIGGDSDTIAAICGSISEAYYGIPDDIKQEAISYLPEEYKKIVTDFYSAVNKKNQGKKLVLDK